MPTVYTCPPLRPPPHTLRKHPAANKPHTTHAATNIPLTQPKENVARRSSTVVRSRTAPARAPRAPTPHAPQRAVKR